MTRDDPDLALHRAGLLSPVKGEDGATWIAHHYKAHKGEWGPCMEGMCGVLVRVIQEWDVAVRPRSEPIVADAQLRRIAESLTYALGGLLADQEEPDPDLSDIQRYAATFLWGATQPADEGDAA